MEPISRRGHEKHMNKFQTEKKVTKTIICNNGLKEMILFVISYTLPTEKHSSEKE